MRKIILILIIAIIGPQLYAQKSSITLFTTKTESKNTYSVLKKDWTYWISYPLKSKVKLQYKENDVILFCEKSYTLTKANSIIHEKDYTMSSYTASDIKGNKHIEIQLYKYKSDKYDLIIIYPKKEKIKYESK